MENNKRKTSPVVLVILDGLGIASPSPGNAVSLAKMPNFDFLQKNYPLTSLCASGECAGLPKNQAGNSEAGHLNLGAGRIVKDDAVYIDEAISRSDFSKNSVFHQAVRWAKKRNSKFHLMGLITEDQSAHSSPHHWSAMIRFLESQNLPGVFLHLFTDGRDSSPHAALKIIKRFEQELNNGKKNSHFFIKIATVAGRFYAMDRGKNWDRIKLVYEALVLGKGLIVENVTEAIIQAYNRGETDEFIQPSVIFADNKPVATVDDGDVLIFMNLRSDRARQLTKVFGQKDFNQKNPGAFIRKKIPKDLFFVALTDFGPDLDYVWTAFPSRQVERSLPFVLKNLRQVYIAETEKYAHVTFFFNGGYDHPVVNEERILIPSVKVHSYDERPEMSAAEICQTALEKIKNGYEFLVVNFANPDMLGHTGNLSAAIKGLEFLDRHLGLLVKEVIKRGGCALVTADHGNVEEMINLKTGEIDTRHSLNPVPFILVGENYKQVKLRKDGILADVAPTILEIVGLEKPKEMTGQSLIKI
jgi:2,3-bisphosphoglycerate-independent phosphoglycerate mutase